MTATLLLLALFGHAFLWVALVNRSHAFLMPVWVKNGLTLACFGGLTMLPLRIGWWLVGAQIDFFGRLPWREFPHILTLYLAVCWVAAGVTVVWWVRRIGRRPPGVLRSHRVRSVQLGPQPGAPASEEHAHHFLVHLPGNEILHLDLSERAIDVPRLEPALDGLSIVHLSDFHFTGRVAKVYFEEVIQRANRLEADIVAVTGDLVDKDAYIDWIPETLGRLRARHGVYFILGNHDTKVDVDRLRKVLCDSGLVDLGGRWVQVEIRGKPVILAGNELPWIAPAADMTGCPPRTPGSGPLRIILSHSPDQLDWAQSQDADLLLAGHTHGGQIRFPLIGPILTPSRTGVTYSSGLFYAPPTIMHVTRGVSGEFPVRLNCPPEMAQLTLNAVK